ncbi:hypothetical protein P3T73_04320 [Kiritimatiellota bacterium B12222]|nr:hypothetical protein P3T73_04320 [Kiritimatiellota bacterium B12222]
MKNTKLSLSYCTILLVSFSFMDSVFADEKVLLDSDFEMVSTETWPQGWPQHEQVSWQNENGNRFLRIQSDSPGEMIMLYRELFIPEGTVALELSWRQRITGLVCGENSWFDARIMMEYMDANREKVAAKLPTPRRAVDSEGWEEKSITFDVPANARILKFMPTLFRVKAGTFEIDDVRLDAVKK